MTRQAVSAACLLLGAKVEEVTKPVKDVVKAILYVRYKHSKPELEAAMVRAPAPTAICWGMHTTFQSCWLCLTDLLLHVSAFSKCADCGGLMVCCMQACHPMHKCLCSQTKGVVREHEVKCSIGVI